MTLEAATQRLVHLLALAEETHAEAVARAARALLVRVLEGRFFVACVGQFKRGKSTVINALIGEPLLPSGVAPITSVVTVVRFGERRARIRFGAKEWNDVPVGDLHRYVSEVDNPENTKGVTGVEVFCPSPLLERGLCLVDTPGISSVFVGNTEETRAFVPQIDAALVVLGGDPPISGDELELVSDISKRVREIVFVLNKADRLSAAELREARSFTESVLVSRRSSAPLLLEISALERLESRGPPRDWPILVTELERLAHLSGIEIVEDAAWRGANLLVTMLRQQLVEERAALLQPIEESERRLDKLRHCAASAEQSLVELTHLFNAEQEKLAKRFDDDRERFVENALPHVIAALTERLDTSPVRHGPRFRRFALDRAQEVTESIVRAWIDEERPIAEREFAAVTERFVAHANMFLERLRSSGELPSGALAELLVAETGLRARSRYYFYSFMTLTTPSIWTWLADWLRTTASVRANVRRAAFPFARRLLEANANRVVGDLNERIVESRRSIENALRRRLLDIVTAAEQAAFRASEVRERGAVAVKDEISAIGVRLARLEQLEGKDTTS